MKDNFWCGSTVLSGIHSHGYTINIHAGGEAAFGFQASFAGFSSVSSLFLLHLPVCVSFLQHLSTCGSCTSVRCYTLPIININPTAPHITFTGITVSEQRSSNRSRSNSQLAVENIFGKSAVIHSVHMSQPSQPPLC